MKIMKHTSTTKSTLNSGFSLIEVLISLIVLSVGLMGLGGLQVAAVKGTNEAHYRTEASLLMMDLADRIRANKEGSDNGSYLSKTPVSCVTEPSIRCDTVACDSNQLALFDLYSIACGLDNDTSKTSGIRDVLPGGELTINCSNDDCSIQANDLQKRHNIAVSWREAKNKEHDVSDGSLYEVKSINLSIIP